jgi:hypothetical protein
MQNEAIRNILLELGLYSLALVFAGSEKELMRMFEMDLENFLAKCQEGV